MKKNLRISLMSFLGVLLAFCLAFSVLCFNNYIAKADGVSITSENFKLVDGASVRPDTPKGLRFELNVSNALKKDLGETNVTYGVLVTLDTLLGSNTLEKDMEDVKTLDIEGINWLDATKVTSGDNYAGFYATLVGGSGSVASDLVDFEEKYYSEVFVARGYVAVGGVVKGYTNTVERTLAGTAKMADGNVNETLQGFINEILESSYVETCNLTFDLGYESTIPDEQLVKGVVVDGYKPENPERSGYTFEGWQYADGTPAFNGEIIKQDITVYAKWSVSVESQAFGPDVISVDSDYADKATYAPGDMSTDFPAYAREGVYKLNKNFVGSDQGFNFDVEALGSMYKAGNIIVIDMFVPGATYVCVKGLQGNLNFTPYGEDGALVDNEGRTVFGWNKMVATIGDVTEGEEADWGHGFGLSHDNFSGQISSVTNKPADVYISGVTIYSPEAFEKYCEDQSAKFSTSVTKQAGVISSIAPTVDGFAKADNFAGPDYDGVVYEYKNLGRGNYNHRRILQIDKTLFGKLFAVGNYILIDVYSNANLSVVTNNGGAVDSTQPKLTAGGTGNGGTYTGEYKQYKVFDGKYIYQSLDLNTGGSWSVMALKITEVTNDVNDTYINLYAGPAKETGGVYFGNVTVCTAEYFEPLIDNTRIVKSGSAISSIAPTVDPYNKVDNFEGPAYNGDVYELTNGGRGNYYHRRILQINKTLFGDLFAVGNYILIDVYCNANLSVFSNKGDVYDSTAPKLTAGGTGNGGTYTGEYKQYKVFDGKYIYQSLDLNTDGSWSVMALKITEVTNDVNDTFINLYAGPAQGAEGVFFGNVTVCAAEYFEPLIDNTRIVKSGSAISSIAPNVDPYNKVDNFEGPAYNGDVYELTNGGRGNYNHRRILQINKTLFGDLFALDNYILIDVYCNANLSVFSNKGDVYDSTAPKLTAGGTGDGGTYTGEYKQYKLEDGKYVYQSLDLNTGGTWSVMALKITEVTKDVNDTFINLYAGPAQGAEGVFFGNVTVCTAEYFESHLAN